jgi:hypothetical protein
MGPLASRTRTPIVGFLLIVLPLLLTPGCGNESGEGPPERDTLTTNGPADSMAAVGGAARTLAARYLGYSYQGASLRSTHPLNDSLFALRTGEGTGSPVVLIDTFRIASSAVTHRDSGHVVQVEVPHAMQVSKTWHLSDAAALRPFTVHIRNDSVTQAPRLVGWPALQRHIRRVEPDSGDAIVERLHTEWADTTGAGPAV